MPDFPLPALKVGDHFVQANPPPGYEMCPMERIVCAIDGATATVKDFPTRREHRVPSTAFNPACWRAITQEDVCETAAGLQRPCRACYGCVGYERKHGTAV